MDDNEVIVFDNLRHQSNVVGEDFENVKVKIKPFNASNAKGVLREVDDLDEVRQMAISAAEETKKLMTSG